MMSLHLDWNEVAAAGSMVGSGAIVVCDDSRCMLDMALNSVRFFRNESCGKCVPCRMGSQKMVLMLDRWMNGAFEEGDRELLDELCHALKQASICGLGQIVPAPIQSVMQHFKQEVEDHLLNKHCAAGVCFSGENA
jgi:NADH-quinone oxidoreductase subunit F